MRECKRDTDWGKEVKWTNDGQEKRKTNTLTQIYVWSNDNGKIAFLDALIINQSAKGNMSQWYPLVCITWLWIWVRGSRASAPKGTKTCRTQGNFRLSVLPSIHPSRPSQAWNLPSWAWNISSQAWNLPSPVLSLRGQIAGLRGQIAGQRGQISGRICINLNPTPQFLLDFSNFPETQKETSDQDKK